MLIKNIKKVFFGIVLCGVLLSLSAEGIAEAQSTFGSNFKSRRPQLNETLPLQKVVLFSSGVGYFEHRGFVEGDTALHVTFGTEEMADILKSLVLQDYDGGAIDSVQYQPPEPLERKLRDFSFNLDSNTSFYELLRQARGEQIEVQIESSQSLTGRIVALETQDGGVTEPSQRQMTLYSEGSMTRVALDEVVKLRFSDPLLQMELQEILTVLAEARRSEQRSLTLHFSGEGRREVMVGYIREMPVWKTTYRLVQQEPELQKAEQQELEQDEKAPTLLQGWAVAENTSNMDWDEVELQLVAGRPISFKMDIYSSLYVTRPELLPQVHTSARPPLYEEGYSGGQSQEPAARRLLAPQQMGTMDYPMEKSSSAELRSPRNENFSSGVAAAASGTEQGGLFAYTIDRPVSLAGHSSALLPIVQQPVEAEKLSVYGAQSTRPLKSLYLKNTTGLHLMGGPVTLFESGMYAGDARFEDILPDNRRLISYAEDLSVQVVREQDPLPEQVVNLSIKKGVFSYVNKQRRATEYRLIQHGTETSKILVQHPKRTGWELVQPAEAEEETASYYRFIRELKEDEESQLLKVVEEYPQERTVQIRNLDSGQISFYLKNVNMSGELRRVLGRIQTLQQRINQLQRQKADVQSKIDSIYRAQERIRNNMEQLDRDSELYREYAARLGRQEVELDALEARLDTHSTQVRSTENELDNFLSNLEIES
ncbi:MAG: hypothetical protein U5P10_07285 [Spirochaetia bacterium]|nr:hypothetical protein [Spirochaetia bacterium]